MSVVIYDPALGAPKRPRQGPVKTMSTLQLGRPQLMGSATTGIFHIEWKPTNEGPLKWTAVNRAGNTVDPYYPTEPNVFSFVLSGMQRLLGRENRFIGTHPTHPYQTRTHALQLRVRAVSALGVTGDWVEVTPIPFRTVTLSALSEPCAGRIAGHGDGDGVAPLVRGCEHSDRGSERREGNQNRGGSNDRHLRAHGRGRTRRRNQARADRGRELALEST